MKAPCVLTRTRCAAAEFRLRAAGSSLRIAALQPALEPIWRQLQDQARNRGEQLWDGLCYRLENLEEVRQGCRVLTLSTIPYSAVRALNVYARNHRLEDRQQPLNVNTGALIQTQDGFFVFGEKQGWDGSARADLVGGGLQPQELQARSGADLESNLFKEMAEEINILPGQVTESKLVGLLLTASWNVIILFTIQLAIDSMELERQFCSRQEHEMAALLVIPRVQAQLFLQNQGGYFHLLNEFLRPGASLPW